MKNPLQSNTSWPRAKNGAALAAAVASGVAAGVHLRGRGMHGDQDSFSLFSDVATDIDDSCFAHGVSALGGGEKRDVNEVEVLRNGREIFPAMLEAITAARSSIRFETFIYWSGDIAKEFASKLANRAQAGVDVRVLIDWVGGMETDEQLFTMMRDAGCKVELFRPLKSSRRVHPSTALHRTHRKLLVVDGKTGFTGGVGIADEWAGDARDENEWRDTHFQLSGAIVTDLSRSFAEHWFEVTGQLECVDDDIHLPEPPDHGDRPVMTAVSSRPTYGLNAAFAVMAISLLAARKSIRITTAYFAPPPAIIDILCDAAARGVDVRILSPGQHNDRPYVREAGRTNYDDLLACGVRIAEFQPTMLHAKILTIDEAFSFVGSINLDSQSLARNDEFGLAIWSKQVADDLNAHFDEDIDRAILIEPGSWQDRGVAKRVRETVLSGARQWL